MGRTRENSLERLEIRMRDEQLTEAQQREVVNFMLGYLAGQLSPEVWDHALDRAVILMRR